MHIHILGICGTFMGGAAILARQLGHKVTGSDANVYPPMSTQLEEQGIEITEGFDPSQLHPTPDLVVIGNAMSRGNACVEYVLNHRIPYTSGPQWLHEMLLKDRWVLAVSGTHGKTTTASMLNWILSDNGYNPGYLIGGVPGNFNTSANLGESMFFVVEADEYDSAFFDKRSKFVHYHPRTLVINNLEFDHADIFDDLGAIQKQFHHLMRTIPSHGRVIRPHGVKAIDDMLAMGNWSEEETLGGDWRSEKQHADGSAFDVYLQDKKVGEVHWDLIGDHNVANAMMAIAAARHVGVTPELACASLAKFINTKRRLEVRGEVAGIVVYDDFAHHPTAVETTLQALRQRDPERRVHAILEPRSATMKRGVHQGRLAPALAKADRIALYQPEGIEWLQEEITHCAPPSALYDDIDILVADVVAQAEKGDQLLVMSNGGFGGIHNKLLAALQEKYDG
ncbi:UDP-N-acetylmuramate:L-alanyl-gamma-D-glutamyl-meso-diaminopimelate ligase [Thaumasiovibrio subtropicus]|uniref:UDP-N-acetylmuramate:L-alanyl-gamma-D-glutamyl- meso-diaminopimelate ligase n=1 Tax=Thaumasiovibrio subtropicus TaxID=1891207 RepID=UPI000B34B7CF|nr:UDP-N-acetylmuramate:L-alanyl-gamma-D-glutamyl-meso-diaminopimelate ligase [Thaumasiovibrio subtropicus]